MRFLVHAIFWTCCLLVITMLVMLGMTVAYINRTGGLIAQQEDDLAVISQQADQAQDEFDSLASKQRQDRADYSPAEAIQASLVVQLARDKLDLLRDKEELTTRLLRDARESLQQYQLRFVPLIGLVLLLVFIGWMFWPWRYLATAKPSSRRGSKWSSRRK